MTFAVFWEGFVGLHKVGNDGVEYIKELDLYVCGGTIIFDF